MKPLKTTALLLIALCCYAAAQTAGTFTDPRDGKTYRTVKIGKQVWMAENLNYKTDSSWCYDNNPDNCKKYGRLYFWNAATKACPVGWHLPSNNEWNTLVNATGGSSAGTRLKSKSPNWNGTDDYGFSALPGGDRSASEIFDDLGSDGYWWTVTEYGSSYASNRDMISGSTHVGEYNNDKSRCLRD
jgi:uncharacterized protein (TIGR02145 family)